MKSSMNKKFYALVFLFIVNALKGIEWSVDNRFGFGPAWHSFSSYTTFESHPTVRERLDVAHAEEFKTQLSLMPYLEGRVRGYLGNHFNMHIDAGGGFFKRQYATVTDSAIEAFPNPGAPFGATYHTFLNARIAIVDAAIGTQWCVGHEGIVLNPLLGYCFNRELLRFNVVGFSDFFDMNNHWKGPYIGLELAIEPYDCWGLRCFYKLVLGHVDSLLRTKIVSKETIVLPPNAPCSLRRASMRGNIFNTEVYYNTTANWKLGLGATFYQYENHCPACTKVLSTAKASFIEKTILKHIVWRQIVCTLFAEYIY